MMPYQSTQLAAGRHLAQLAAGLAQLAAMYHGSLYHVPGYLDIE